MRAPGAAFLPDRLRPRLRLGRRPRRRPIILVVVVPLLLALLPWWRIQAVEIEGLAQVPDVVAGGLASYVGTPAIGLDLAEVRRRVEAWPGIDGVDVRFELPGRVRVLAHAARPCASLRIGRGWRGVAVDGALAGALSAPLEPQLSGFGTDPLVLRTALAVVRRLARATGGTVVAVRAVAPDDFALELRPAAAGALLTVVVGRDCSRGESYWSARVAAGDPPGTWCDARSDERLVIGGAA